MVWVTEWNQFEQFSSNVVISNDELQALTCAASLIMKVIGEEWDMSDPQVKDNALFISDQFAALNWRDGMRFFNECEANKNNTQQVKVYERAPDTRIWPIKLLRSIGPMKEFDVDAFMKDSYPPPPMCASPVWDGGNCDCDLCRNCG